MQFVYHAKKNTGEETKGIMEAKDKFDLARILRQQGEILILADGAGEKSKFSLSSFSFSFGNVPLADKMMFSRNLSAMISAGLPATRAMEILSRQTKNKKFQKTLLAIMETIQKGTALSEAMKQYPKIFSPLFVAMVRTGEETGQLSESLKLVGDQLERDYNLTKKVKGALVYPSIILVAMFGIGIFMMIYVVPTLVGTFKEMNIELPMSTQIVIAISDFLVAHTVAGISIIFVVIGAVAWGLKTQKGKDALDFIVLKAPLFSPIAKKINSARTSRTLASLINAGVNVVDALSITEDVLQNHYYKKVLSDAKTEVQKGIAISDSFKKASDLYPILVGEMMSVGEETGKLSEMLNRLAVFYEEEVTEATKDLTTVVEPILMIFIGVAVGFFAVSMIKPMYSMMSGI